MSLSAFLNASITFNGHASHMAINPVNSVLGITNAAKILGCSKQSVVNTFGCATANLWREGYGAASALIGQGLTKPPTTLIVSNSDAVTVLSRFARADSQALLFLNRGNSSAIVVLDKTVRTNSNSTATYVRTFSNAYTYGDRVNSNAVVYLSTIVSQNRDIGNNINGTSLVVYQPYHHVFHGVGSARGFVRFNAGFTVLPNASVLMDTLETVSGGFDLRETGTLILNNDLYLSGNVTLTSGGNIKGKSSVSGSGNTIFLGGDLTLSSTNVGRVIHITGDWTNSGTSGDTIIDGCGHSLWIGDRSQIFVDTNVTLTLKNMVIHTSPKSVGSVPAIQLAAHGSTLVLDNVVLDLGSDFNFMQGQLFIHDDVLVTGTSAFVYQSPRPSYITAGGTWMFDQGTTFSFAPSAFTDGPYTQDYKSTSTTNNFLIMADPSSVLALNGCTLKTTYTGLRLRMGTVLMDNRVQIDTMAGVDINSTTPATSLGTVGSGVNPTAVAWSPDGRFLVVANNGSASMQLYRFDGTGAPVSLGTVATGSNPHQLSWSLDGRFIAVTNNVSNTLQVFRFNGSGAPVSLGSVATGLAPFSVAFSKDGRFIALVNDTDSTLQVYRFTVTDLPISLGTVATGTRPISVVWSPDGRFVAVVNRTAPNYLQVYRFMGSGMPVLVSTVTAGNTAFSVAWSPDGRFLAVANFGDGTLQLYRFTGTGLSVLLGSVATSAVGSDSVAWSPDGRFLVVVHRVASPTLEVLRCNGSGLPVSLGSVAVVKDPRKGTWSPNGQFIAVANCIFGDLLQVFRVNYIRIVESQAKSSTLIFGDSANGSAFDANVQLLSGARVELKGMVCDDSA